MISEHDLALEGIPLDDEFLIQRKHLDPDIIKVLNTTFGVEIAANKKPFAETLAEYFYMRDEYNKTLNFILTGAPSSGKTTELQKVAILLKKKLPRESNKILHFCSIQNTSGSHKEITTEDDLWSLILHSHCSRHWALKNWSVEQFLDWHDGENYQPILFIDTIDLLTYGISHLGNDGIGQKKIGSLWGSLLKKLNSNDKVKPAIFWSSREVEWNETKEFLEPNDQPTEIHLPALDYRTVDEVGIYSIFEIPEEEKLFFRYIQQAFPILAGYARKGLLPTKAVEFLKEQLMVIKKSVAFKPEEKVSPLPWIMNQLNRKFATDYLYEALVEKICQKAFRDFDRKGKIEDFEEIWEEYVEQEFFYESLPDHNTIGGRIQVRIKSNSMELDHLILLAKRNGLLNERMNGLFEMGHQLFAEWCLYKHGSSNDYANDDEVQMKLAGFPSYWLRTYENHYNSHKLSDAAIATRVDEAKSWLYPFAVFNIKLIEYESEEYISQEWKELIEIAVSVRGADKKSEIPIYPTSSIHWLNDEKKEMLEAHQLSNNPVLVNGPPGVGKSHLSFVWADSKMFQIAERKWIPKNKGEWTEKEWERKIGTERYNVMFMTLNKNLIKQQRKRIDEYYNKSKFVPMDWNTFDIENYLDKLCKILNINWKKLDFKSFEQRFETNLIRSRNQPLLNDVRKKSISALWLEYNTNYIDRSGRKSNPDSYSRSRSNLFDKSDQEAMKEFAEYCESEFENVHSIPEIAGEIIDRVLTIESEGTREQKEQLQTLKSDILILDEVQDLTSPIISLLLIMHAGPLHSILICGDDEQTLLINPFDWKQTFKKINTYFYEKLESDYPHSSQLNKLMNLDWGKEAEDKIVNLRVVERNVEAIVNFISDSWNTSIGEMVHPEPSTVRKGAGAVVAGLRSKESERKLMNEGRVHGVFQENIDSEGFVKVCRDIYESDQDAAVIFTDEIIRDEYYERLEKLNIKIPLYTPSGIKGLEYPIIIAVSPWSMRLTTMKNEFRFNLDMTTWEDLKYYYNSGNLTNKDRNQLIEKVLLQRKRFANIIISRAENLLVIYNLIPNNEDAEETFIHFDEPKTFYKQKPIEIGYDQWSNSSEEMVIEEKLKPEERSITADKLIHRLHVMIESANHKENSKEIAMQSLHIAHVLRQQLRHESESDKLILPFDLIGKPPVQISDGFSVKSIVELLDFIKKICGGEIEIHDWIKEQKKLLKHIESEDILQIPYDTYNTFENALEEKLSKLFKPSNLCFSDSFRKWNSNEVDSIREGIQRYLSELYLKNFVKRTKLENNPNKWADIFDSLSLDSFTIELPLVKANKGYEVKSKNKKIFEIIMPKKTKIRISSTSKQEQFWMDGKTILRRDEEKKNAFSKIQIDSFYEKLSKSQIQAFKNIELNSFFEKLHSRYINLTDIQANDDDDERIELSIDGYLRLQDLEFGPSEKREFGNKHEPRFLKFLLKHVFEFRIIIERNPLNLWNKLKSYLLKNDHLVKDGKIKEEWKTLRYSNSGDEVKKDVFWDLKGTVKSLVEILKNDATDGQLSSTASKEIMQTIVGMIQNNLFFTQEFEIGNPRSLKDIFGFETVSVPITNFFLESIKSSDLEKLILHLYENIYRDIDPKQKGYNEQFINNWAELKDELNVHNGGGKIPKFTEAFALRILKIPTFGNLGKDLIFERETNQNPSGQKWLKRFEDSSLPTIRHGGKRHRDLKEKVDAIRLKHFHFEEVYLNEPTRSIAIKSHILENIQDVDWRKMVLDKKSYWKTKGGLLRDVGPLFDSKQFISQKDKRTKPALFGNYSYHALIILYNRLREVRVKWNAQISSLESNPYRLANKEMEKHMGREIANQWSKPTSDDLDKSDIVDHVLSTIKKLEKSENRLLLIEELKTIISVMTEPRFFLTTLLDRFDFKIKGQGILWNTLKTDLFYSTGTLPQWFSTAKKTEKMSLKYSDFINCILQFTGEQYIDGKDLFSDLFYWTQHNGGDVADDFENSFIRLLQTYGVPKDRRLSTGVIENRKFKNEFRKEIRTLDLNYLDKELKERLKLEILNLPQLEKNHTRR